MKKLVLFLLCVFSLFQMKIVCYAANAVDITANDVFINKNEIKSVTVNAKSNSGIMGFRISVDYPTDKVNIKSVSRGSLTKNGNFNTSLGIKSGTFDVVWNSVENIVGDGTIFVMELELNENTTKDFEIKLRYTQADTFNESWKDVVLKCDNITVRVGGNADNNSDATDEQTENSSVGASQVVDAVNKALEENAYEDEFVANISALVAHNDIKESINDALNNVGAKSFGDLNQNNMQKFVEDFEKNLKEFDPELSSISSEITTEKAVEIIEKLYTSIDSDENIQTLKKLKNNNMCIYIFIVTVSVILIIGIIVIIIKTKRVNIR